MWGQKNHCGRRENFILDSFLFIRLATKNFFEQSFGFGRAAKRPTRTIPTSIDRRAGSWKGNSLEDDLWRIFRRIFLRSMEKIGSSPLTLTNRLSISWFTRVLVVGVVGNFAIRLEKQHININHDWRNSRAIPKWLHFFVESTQSQISYKNQETFFRSSSWLHSKVEDSSWVRQTWISGEPSAGTTTPSSVSAAANVSRSYSYSNRFCR